MVKVIERFVYFFTLEFLLSKRNNGGTVILMRSLFLAVILYGMTLLAKWWLGSEDIKTVLGDTITWFGAIFAGIYASFYSRFASQWQYLATLYNNILAAEVNAAAALEQANREAPGPHTVEAVAKWKAAFIADSETLHLTNKPLFAGVVTRWGQQADVRRAFEQFGNSVAHLDDLIRGAGSAVVSDADAVCNAGLESKPLASASGAPVRVSTVAADTDDDAAEEVSRVDNRSDLIDAVPETEREEVASNR